MAELSPADRRLVLRSLPAFTAVAETGQVRLAAAVLGEPESVVSRTIQRLQSVLGVALFERKGRGLVLTEAGRQLLPDAQAGLAQIDAGLRSLQQRAVVEGDTIRLAFQSLLGSRIVPQLVKEFRRSFPGVEFELVQGSRTRGLELLEAGGVDIALTSSPPTRRGSVTMELTVEPLVALVPRGHALDSRRAVSVAELADEEIILLTPEFDVYRLVTDLFASAGRFPRIGLTAEDYYTVRGLVSAGLGVSIMPSMARVEDGVREVPIDSPMARRSIGAVVREDPGRPALVQFVQLLRAAATR